MSTNRLFRIAGAVAFATIVGACVDDPTAPLAARVGTSVPALAVTGGPDLGDWRSFQGEVWICKDANTTGTSFDLDWSVSTYLGAPLVNGTVTVPAGGCVMAVHLDTVSSVRVHIDVTEHALPPNWALTGINIDYGTGFPGTVDIPVVNLTARTITGVHASNDFGVQITYFNTYTPPETPACTYTQGFWKNHQELWDTNGEMVVWTGQLFFNSGVTYAEIFDMPPAGGNSYLKLAHQYIAAKLNVNVLGDPAVNAYIAQAEALFAGQPAGSYFIKSATWNLLAERLGDYNEGLIGPGHCDF